MWLGQGQAQHALFSLTVEETQGQLVADLAAQLAASGDGELGGEGKRARILHLQLLDKGAQLAVARCQQLPAVLDAGFLTW